MQSGAHRLGHKTDARYHLKDVLREHWTDETKTERDLGIQIASNLKQSAPCVKVVGKARSILGMIKRNFRRID